ncbi:MAG TPA: AsnC family transcriptional regulator, partial [Solirubrobacteraceae bacterium]
MASVSSRHGPKLRARKHGAAIPLDDLDRRLLNLMQGSFPIARRPYQHVAAQAGISEGEAMARVKRLLDERIIRQVTPIFDTRALGYSSMLVAAKVDPENPWRAANVINEHPGVSHNYLRNHEFNIWFTIATEPDSRLGLQGTLELLGRLAGAESIRQLPTLKLFKIRMDLEMEGTTADLAQAVEATEPAETERQPYDELDVAVILALQGSMPVVAEPYAPAAATLQMSQEAFLQHLEAMQQRRLLRRVAAILYHRRAGFSANGMGVWKVPDERVMELGPKMAAFRGISHCYQRPTYQDWPYSIFTMAHGRSPEECDAILDSIAEATGIDERATLY